MSKYIVVNNLTGFVCFNGHKFRTSKGAARKIKRAGWFGKFMHLRKIL